LDAIPFNLQSFICKTHGFIAWPIPTCTKEVMHIAQFQLSVQVTLRALCTI